MNTYKIMITSGSSFNKPSSSLSISLQQYVRIYELFSSRHWRSPLEDEVRGKVRNIDWKLGGGQLLRIQLVQVPTKTRLFIIVYHHNTFKKMNAWDKYKECFFNNELEPFFEGLRVAKCILNIQKLRYLHFTNKITADYD